MEREQIKQIFLDNGFTVKDGLDDLKPYVYAAAEALIAAEREACAKVCENLQYEGHDRFLVCAQAIRERPNI